MSCIGNVDIMSGGPVEVSKHVSALMFVSLILIGTSIGRVPLCSAEKVYSRERVHGETGVEKAAAVGRFHTCSGGQDIARLANYEAGRWVKKICRGRRTDGDVYCSRMFLSPRRTFV